MILDHTCIVVGEHSRPSEPHRLIKLIDRYHAGVVVPFRHLSLKLTPNRVEWVAIQHDYFLKSCDIVVHTEWRDDSLLYVAAVVVDRVHQNQTHGSIAMKIPGK